MRIGYNARLLVDPGLRGWSRNTIILLEALPRQARSVAFSWDRAAEATLAVYRALEKP